MALRVRISHLALLAALAATLPLGGCSKVNFGDITASNRIEVPEDPAALSAYLESWGKRYDGNPNDRNVALAYAKGLRAAQRGAQAVAVLQSLALKNSSDMDVLGEYGKALADVGRLKEAADVLANAHTPERPNWRILSAQGSVADQMGQHEQAQGYYNAALKIVPNEPGVLSNLGLSYALMKNLQAAEQTLRLAAAQPHAGARVRQNLALVLALQGKFQEAEQVSRTDLSPQDAANNVQAIRAMIAQSSTWKDIQTGGKAGQKGSKG